MASRLLVALLLLVPPAARASTRRCSDAVAAVGIESFVRSLTALAACQHRVARGKLPPTTDCTAAHTQTSSALARRLRRACPETPAGIAGGECEGMHDAAALTTCIEETHAADAAAVARLTGTTADASARARRCQERAAAAVRAYAVRQVRVVARCKRRPPADLSPGSACTSTPAVGRALGILATRASRPIAAGCPDDVLRTTRIPGPCAGAPTATGLTQCLLAAADAAADDALRTAFPDPGFCGDAAARVEARVDALLAKMTPAEKIDQMHGANLIGRSFVAGNDRLHLPELTMNDGPRGVGINAGGSAVAFPVGMARGATWDPELETRVGEAMGAEARAKGVSVLLAPTMNILRHPRWGRAQETYGEDTLHLGRMASAFIRGVQQHILASAKHFAAYSIEDTRFMVSANMDERTLREVYLPHFRMAVQDGHAGSVMSAYNRLNDTYCDENGHILHDILKGEWAFQGFVESDWVLGTHSTVESAAAGLDVEMPTGVHFGKPLADALAAGQVPSATVDGAVRRNLRARLCFRLDTEPPTPDPTQIGTPAHTSLALEVARKSIVLLKNAAGTLPLDRSAVHSLVVVSARTIPHGVGEVPLATVANIGDAGSSIVNPTETVAPLDGIRAAAGAVTVTHVPAPLAPADTATVAAADAVVVVAGLSAVDEGEKVVVGGDRVGLALPGTQDDVIAAVAALNPRTVVVIEASGPVTMPWLDAVPAVLMAWYPGQEGGTAIGDVLFGDVVPSGRLPVSFPVAEADLPPFVNAPDQLEVPYGYFHGYRWLDRNGTAPLFPFGFGLSYTSFHYANLTLAPVTVPAHGRVHVTVDVTNTGAVAGDEVAQLYVGYEHPSVERAVDDLKAFQRVHLDPGQTTTVAFDLRAADLAFWDVAAGAWKVDPITYDVRVGPSSRDLPLSGTFAVAP